MDMAPDVNPFPGRTGPGVQGTGDETTERKSPSVPLLKGGFEFQFRGETDPSGAGLGEERLLRGLGAFSAAVCMDFLTPARASAIDPATPF